MATYSIFILLAIPPPPQIEPETKISSTCFAPPPPSPPPPKKKELGEVTILWLGMENEFWLENTRLRLIANFNYYNSNAISVSDSSAHFVAVFLH